MNARTTYYYQTPLFLAVEENRSQIVLKLLDASICMHDIDRRPYIRHSCVPLGTEMAWVSEMAGVIGMAGTDNTILLYIHLWNKQNIGHTHSLYVEP